MGSSEFSDNDLSQDSDYDLIEMITWSSSDEEVAKAAWSEFYTRHHVYVYKTLYYITKKNQDLSIDITQDTFFKVFEKAAITFKIPKESNNKAEQHVRLWLSKIARNLLIDYFRESDTQSFDEEIEDIRLGEEAEDDSDKEELLLANRVREIYEGQLNERERTVLDLALLYDDPQNKYAKIPKNELDNVCQKLGITSENFRQIKSRAIKKIREKMSVEMAETF